MVRQKAGSQKSTYTAGGNKFRAKTGDGTANAKDFLGGTKKYLVTYRL